MTIIAALLICLAVKVIHAVELECRNLVSCPCGSSRENVTVCVSDASAYIEVCARLSKCESCEEGSNVCLKCLEGVENVICSQEKNKSRQKRQMIYTRGFRPKPRTGSQQTSVPLTYCWHPGDISNGRFVHVRKIASDESEEEYLEGSQVQYSCDNGYNLIGSPTLICESTGRWSSALPTCIRDKPLTCKSLGYFSNGQAVHQNVDGTSGVGDIYVEGSRLNYSCDMGYVLVGSPTLECEETGLWSAEQPICRERYSFNYCPYPGGIVNGQLVYKPGLIERRGTSDETEEDYPEGSRLKYSCDDGYHIEGSAILTCENTSRWSSTPPTCEKDKPTVCNIVINRSGVSAVVHQTANGARIFDYLYLVGHRLVYSCQKGYIMVGSPILVCEKTGLWSAKEPICRRDEPPNCKIQNKNFWNGDYVHQIANGTQSFHDCYLVGHRMVYSCNKGYILVGTSTLVCKRTGHWSAKQPICRRVPGTPANCKHPGFLYRGETVVVRKTDSDVREYEYGEGSQVQYSCHDGYNLVGSLTRTCQNTGRWSGHETKCERDEQPECEFLQNIDWNSHSVHQTANGTESVGLYLAGHRMVFSCIKGYILVGSSTLVCEETGLWSAEPPICRRVPGTPTNCKYPPSLYRGETVEVRKTASDVRENEYGEGSQAHYSCHDGYNLVGSLTRTCESTGMWSGDETKCERDEQPDCKLPGVFFFNGDYVHQTADGSPSNGYLYLVGHRLVYSCKQGYILVGSSTLVCEETVLWSAEQPICRPV